MSSYLRAGDQDRQKRIYGRDASSYTQTDRVTTLGEAGASVRGGGLPGRQRVLDALGHLAAAGQEISVSAVARKAGVDRSFLYRHHDLRAQIHARSAAPATSPASTTASKQSLIADLANLREQEPAAPQAEHRPHRPAVGSPRRGSLPRQRNRAHRRHRGTPNTHRPARTASTRPAPGTRGTHRRPRRRPRRQSRPHITSQPETQLCRRILSVHAAQP